MFVLQFPIDWPIFATVFLCIHIAVVVDHRESLFPTIFYPNFLIHSVFLANHHLDIHDSVILNVHFQSGPLLLILQLFLVIFLAILQGSDVHVFVVDTLYIEQCLR